MKSGVLAFGAAALLLAMPVTAQTADDSQPSDEDVIAAAIGCVATYDMVLSKGAGAKITAIKTARQSAVDIYKEYSGLSDQDVEAAIAKADRLFPDIVARSGSTLRDYEQSCDDAFMDVTATPPATTTAWHVRPLQFKSGRQG